MASNNVKKRNWAFVLYPESAPNNWREQLQDTGLQCAISPLHDRDVNPDGEPKKPHYHVILCYAGPQTYSAVKKLTEHLRQPIPQPLEAVRGYYRYLTHEDNPEKAQYSKLDIEHLNGFDVRAFVELTKTEVLKIKRDLIQFVQDNDILEYADLLEILLAAGDQMADWLDVATSNSILFVSYIKSRKFRKTGRE